MLHAIVDCFIFVRSWIAFLSLTPELMRGVLHRDDLAVADEKEVFLSLIRWLEHSDGVEDNLNSRKSSCSLFDFQ